MARLTRLRPILARVVLAQLSALGVAACCGEDPPLEADVSFVDPSPEDAERLTRCVKDATDCAALCDEALRRVLGEEEVLAGAYVKECTLTVMSGVEGPLVHIVYEDGSICGRAPVGLASSGRVDADDPVGAWLAEAAHLEAASVVAFVQLAVDLARQGAPTVLVEGALAAARDEVRHADAMSTLARARGVEPRPVACQPYRAAPLLELATHNAVEGCVRETLGAAINAWQAHRAEDAELRRVFAEIADDEAAHAELGWQIDAWARSQLSDADYARVLDARQAARAAIVEAGDGSSPDVRRVLGLPSAAQTRKLAHAVTSVLAA